jgi:hypothetical protein
MYALLFSQRSPLARASLFVFIYLHHRPEAHILLFRRPLGTDPQSGRVDPELARQARDEYKNQFGLRKN